MASRTSQWRQLNTRILEPLETDADTEGVFIQENDAHYANVSYSYNDVELSSADSFLEPDNIESSDCSSDESYLSEVGNNLKSELASWAMQQNISHIALNNLLKILQKHVNEDLPTDARTVLKTPKQITSHKRCGGDFVHFGIKSDLSRRSNLVGLTKVSLIVNIDGLPLFKSGSTEVWPILGAINRGIPFVISLWSGNGKPNSVDDFLKEFLSEYNALCLSGVETGSGVIEF